MRETRRTIWVRGGHWELGWVVLCTARLLSRRRFRGSPLSVFWGAAITDGLQAGWVNQIEAHCPPAAEARSPRSECWQGWLLVRAVGPCHLCPPPMYGALTWFLRLEIAVFSLWLHVVFLLWVFGRPRFPFLRKFSRTGLGDRVPKASAETLFPNKVTALRLGVRTSVSYFSGEIEHVEMPFGGLSKAKNG